MEVLGVPETPPKASVETPASLNFTVSEAVGEIASVVDDDCAYAEAVLLLGAPKVHEWLDTPGPLPPDPFSYVYSASRKEPVMLNWLEGLG